MCYRRDDLEGKQKREQVNGYATGADLTWSRRQSSAGTHNPSQNLTLRA